MPGKSNVFQQRDACLPVFSTIIYFFGCNLNNDWISLHVTRSELRGDKTDELVKKKHLMYEASHFQHEMKKLVIIFQEKA